LLFHRKFNLWNKKMLRRTINVCLTLEERKRLETILKSNQSTLNDRQKAEVLLLTDVGERGPKISPAHAAETIGLSERSVGRIRGIYAENSSIDDVFRFAKLSQQSSRQTHEKAVDPLNPTSFKKKNLRYVEMGDGGNNPFLIENVKCRVTLTREERERLESIIKEGKQTVRKFNRAKILLLADEGIEGPAMTDTEIADKLDVSVPTVARVRRLLITKGLIDDVLNSNHHNAGRPPKIDGVVQATLVAQACSKPPEGRCRWTVRLLADRLVELEVVDSISHTAVGTALKKTNLNLGSEKSG
jgi:hypothetical protein